MIESVCELIGEIDTDYEELTGEASIQTIEIPPVLQEKEVNPTTEIQIVAPDEGYNGLSQVTVNPIAMNYQEKEIIPTKETQTVTPDDGYDALSRVDVKPIPDNYIEMSGSIYDTEDATATADDIINGKTAYIASGKVTGTFESPNISLTYTGNDTQSDNSFDLYINENIPSYGFCTTSGNGVFNLSKVISGNNCEIIGARAFQNQKKCTEYDFTRGVKTLNGLALNSAIGADVIIKLGENCLNIGSQAIYDCPKYIYCYAIKPPTLNTFNFWSKTNLIAIYVPNDSVDSYKSATNWSAVASYIKPLSEAEGI